MTTLPYNPTVLLSPSNNNDLVYILDSSTGDSSSVRLRALNVSNSVSASDLTYIDITDQVPFGQEDGIAYSSFISDNGTVYTLAGKCADGADGANAWTFAPKEDGTSGDWAQGIIDVQETGNTSIGGANYLAGGLAFSSNLNASDDMYVFGGMCPQSSDESASTWQASATYSNSLLHLQRSQAQGASSYSLETVNSRAQPIPEAGFSITALSPTYFNATGGNVTMQQNFVLLGGHTASAFVNMSQIAILSLPEQTWTFVPVAGPTTSKRDTSAVDPRSGHAAVLSEDGQQILLIGGWVGDVGTPADPQLAILEIGEGYGGVGSWQWSSLSATGPGPLASGLYGHGATLLPGNVVMVSGGFEIDANQGELAKRSTPGTYFFNITSKSWANSYQNPNWGKSQDSTSSTSGSTRIGLGAGLGVGLAILLALVIGILYLRRKKRRERKVHDNDLRTLALGNTELRHPSFGLGGIDGRGGDFSTALWRGNHADDTTNAYPWAPTLRNTSVSGQVRPNEAERTGLLVEIPSPTRGLRRSLHSRGSYWYEDGRRSRGSSYIHRIEERDEDESAGAEPLNNAPAEMVQLNDGAFVARPVSRPLSDPFRDPPEPRSLLDGSRSPSPQLLIQTATPGAMENESGTDWPGTTAIEVNDLAPPQAARAPSALSNRSAPSMVSALSQQPSSGSDSLKRTASQHSGAPNSTGQVNAGISTDFHQDLHRFNERNAGSPPAIKRRPLPLGSHPTPPRRSLALQPGSSPSSFSQLQAEGPNLLLGTPPSAHRNPQAGYVAGVVAAIEDNNFDPEPLSRRKQHRAGGGLMGSMRRALAVSATVASHASRGNTTTGATSRNGASSPRKTEFFSSNGGGASSSDPAPAGGLSQGARPRSSSMDDRDMPWGRHQQGARAWADDQRCHTLDDRSPIGDWGAPSPSGRMSQRSLYGASAGSSENAESAEDGDGEWDVESAVERRVVQLMFTVPKEKLRVVNRTPGEGDGHSLKSRASVRSTTSARSLRVSSEPPAGEQALVTTTSPLADVILEIPRDEFQSQIANTQHALDLDNDSDDDQNTPIRVSAHPISHYRLHTGSDGYASLCQPVATEEGDNYIIHNLTDDEEEQNFIVHAHTDDELDSDDGEHTMVQSTGNVPSVSGAVDAAAERLRVASGEEAVEQVRAASGESARARTGK